MERKPKQKHIAFPGNFIMVPYQKTNKFFTNVMFGIVATLIIFFLEQMQKMLRIEIKSTVMLMVFASMMRNLLTIKSVKLVACTLLAAGITYALARTLAWPTQLFIKPLQAERGST